ncbi:MAG: PaaI family thioesterase [Desulfatiglandales bacterium]|jgi:uncharacterized protein (TIGR00369 family)|nr:PaaI family thioesterase [Desulfatiglandales bacterium]
MGNDRIAIPKPRGHHCFACGTDNPIGLNLQFYRIGDALFSDIILKKVHEGWEGMAHGGIVSTLIDEVMSWVIMYSKRVFLVTRNTTVKYIRPVLIGAPLTVTGRLIDESGPPKIKAEAEIRDGEERLLVRGVGEFVVLPKEKFSLISENFREEMETLFKKFKDSS